jgi:SAM-dependent methyltransferase
MAGNEEQIEYWNGAAGTTWAESQERLDRLLAPLSEQAVNAANPQSGERVLDIGCGCGATTLAMLERGAEVCGVDISAPMLERARARTQSYDGATFIEADAAKHGFERTHTLAFSRFGVMFFDDPVAAFGNIRSGLIEQGRLAFVCWQAPPQNDWIYVAGKALQSHLPEPAAAPDPRAPGPFAFADPDYVRGILADAGFTDIGIDGVTAELHLADTLDEAVEFQGRVGPVARALAELEGEQKEAALAAARDALSNYVTPEGISLGSAAWIVTANA